MKKNNENQPIDDLFARKLGNLSLPPSAGGYERLQARMNQQDQKRSLVVWRNPVVQRYLAVAACLLAVCLFGWLYWPTIDKNDAQVAIKSTTHRTPKNRVHRLEKEASEAVAKTTHESHAKETTPETPVAVATTTIRDRSANTHVTHMGSKSRFTKDLESTKAIEGTNSKSILAQIQPARKDNTINMPAITETTNTAVSEQVAENKPKVMTPSERVLVVTIEEPVVLAAARQGKINSEEKVAMAADEKESKETKGGGIWQQVKRFKHGELFAQSDKVVNDDQGLLSRAYTGLKQSLDKGKSIKQ